MKLTKEGASYGSPSDASIHSLAVPTYSWWKATNEDGDLKAENMQLACGRACCNYTTVTSINNLKHQHEVAPSPWNTTSLD